MKGSILIDAIIKSEHCQVGITDEKTKKERRYIAKPEKIRGIFEKINRLKAAWLVLTDRAFAVHYKEDEKRI